METNLYQTDSLEIKRSEIHLSDYNPRKITAKAKALLKKNIKGHGLMGGIIWNKVTGNLVAGHQRITILDELQGYPENDYLIRVELVELTEQQEKEQNIFLNNKNAQGEYDNALLAGLIGDIDYKAAGLDDSDLKIIQLEVPNITFGPADSIQNDMKSMDAPYNQAKQIDKEANKQKVIAEKEAIKQRIESRQQEGEPFVTLSFQNFDHKAEFMERFGYEPYEKILPGEEFANKVERVSE
jgi:hypothetical protein